MNDTFIGNWFLIKGVEDFVVLDPHPEVKCPSKCSSRGGGEEEEKFDWESQLV